MANSYSTPLTYGPQQTPLNQNGFQQPDYSNATYAGPGSITGLIAGGGTGAYLGYRQNPFITKNGEIKDSFTKNVFEKYVEKSSNGIKECYNGSLNILEKIDSTRTPEELKTLFENNKEAAKEICNEMKQAPEEFIANITKDNLSENKKIIKEKITAGNNTRYQDIKNQIQASWDKEAKKFIKTDSIKEDVYKSIKKSTNGAKGKLIAKYAAIGALALGIIGFIIGKFIPMGRNR